MTRDRFFALLSVVESPSVVFFETSPASRNVVLRGGNLHLVRGYRRDSRGYPILRTFRARPGLNPLVAELDSLDRAHRCAEELNQWITEYQALQPSHLTHLTTKSSSK